MPVFVALIRGINVGGNRLIPMEELRALCPGLGFGNARTLLQSGNLVFTAGRAKREAIEARLGEAIAERFGFRPEILVRTPAELRSVVAANPFPEMAKDDPSHLLVIFLKGWADAEAIAGLAGYAKANETITPGEEALYVAYPEGIGTSKLTGALIEKRLGMVGTGRNWSTIVKILKLAEATG